MAVRGRDARRTSWHAAVLAMVQESGATFDFSRHGGAAELSERGTGMCGDGVGCWDGMGWCEERDGWDCVESVVGWGRSLVGRI